jgi:hypothetical protein
MSETSKSLERIKVNKNSYHQDTEKAKLVKKSAAVISQQPLVNNFLSLAVAVNGSKVRLQGQG